MQGQVDRSTCDQRVQELLALYDSAGVDVAHLLCDQRPPDAVAFTIVSPDLSEQTITYGMLAEASTRIAAGLASLGVGQGDRVATLIGKSTEHLVAVLAIWRLGAVHVPLFTAFAAPAVAMRLAGSGAKVVVCDEDQRPKLENDVTALSAPWRVVVSGAPAQTNDLSFDDLLQETSGQNRGVRLTGDAPLIQLYTSGTTGRPKAVVVPVRALAAFHAYMEFGLDVRPDDVLWNAADPGWAYGHYYGLAGPLCVGVPSVWLRGGFSAELTLRVLSQLRVTNLAAAPTVYRQIRGSGLPIPDDLRLRCASAAGEPLTPEINEWAQGALGVAVHDHYGQTETGMLINNHHHQALRRPSPPGSMGHPMPGWTAAVLREDGCEEAAPGVVGRIAIDRQASPFAWFDGYLDDPERSAEKFTADGRWYLTGDAGQRDEDGYFHFLSRDDDVIIMAGYRIGPFDVESVMLQHPAVAEAAVVGAPDALRGEVLEAFVVLRDGYDEAPELSAELQSLVKTKLAAHAYPRTVHFTPSLPKTPSGKIQRFVLRERRRAELAAASR